MKVILGRFVFAIHLGIVGLHAQSIQARLVIQTLLAPMKILLIFGFQVTITEGMDSQFSA